MNFELLFIFVIFINVSHALFSISVIHNSFNNLVREVTVWLDQNDSSSLAVDAANLTHVSSICSFFRGFLFRCGLYG